MTLEAKQGSLLKRPNPYGGDPEPLMLDGERLQAEGEAILLPKIKGHGLGAVGFRKGLIGGPSRK